MFESTLTKLTALYLAIIMVISLFFSVILYRTSAQELDRGYRHHAQIIQNIPRLRPLLNEQSFIDQINHELISGRQRILAQLLYINLFIFAAGGGLSYVLAKRTLKPIKESHEAQSRFSADASHELRTPIAAMQSEIEVALRDPKLNKQEARKLLSSNLEELAKLTLLTEGLLKLSKLENTNLDKHRIDMKEVVIAAINRLKPIANKKEIKMSFKPDSKTYIKGDEKSLEELVTIFLDNAVKYSPEKSVISVSLSRIQNHLELKIKDEGKGIKQSELPHIFDRFYRADSSRSSTNVQGYGLGLSIAKSIADLHDARVSVQSTPGKGTTIKVRFAAAN